MGVRPGPKTQKPLGRGFGRTFGEGLSSFYVNGIGAFFALGHFEGNLVVLPDFVYQTRNVHENVLIRPINGNEAESFRFIEKFNCT